MNSKMKAAEVVFSLVEVLLLIERGKKNAASAAFNSNFGDPGGTRNLLRKFLPLLLARNPSLASCGCFMVWS